MRNSKQGKRVVAYCRVSTSEQADEGVSLDAQAAAVRAYAEMRGLDLIDVVIDAGVSAGKPLARRDGGRCVLELVRRGDVDAVIAWKLDRLFRDCADCLTTTRKWDRCSVALHLVDMGGQAVDTSSAMGRFFLTVMAGCAELERGQVRERTRAGLAHKKARGERVGAVPFGMRVAADGVHLERDEREQAVVERIRSLREGGMSLRGIVAELNSSNTPARGARWHVTSVRRVLARAA